MPLSVPGLLPPPYLPAGEVGGTNPTVTIPRDHPAAGRPGADGDVGGPAAARFLTALDGVDLDLRPAELAGCRRTP